MKRYLDPAALLDNYKDVSLIETMILHFCQGLEKDAADLAYILEDGIDENTADAAFQVVHRTKGAALAMGAFSIVAYCESVAIPISEKQWRIADYNAGSLLEDMLQCIKTMSH